MAIASSIADMPFTVYPPETKVGDEALPLTNISAFRPSCNWKRIAYNEVARQYNAAVDDMFASLHAENGTLKPQKQKNGEPPKPEYRKQDYERVAFTSKAEERKFIFEMKKMGVEVTPAGQKLNGQYLVEIPAEIDRYKFDTMTDGIKFAPQNVTLKEEQTDLLHALYSDDSIRKQLSPDAGAALQEAITLNEVTSFERREELEKALSSQTVQDSLNADQQLILTDILHTVHLNGKEQSDYNEQKKNEASGQKVQASDFVKTYNAMGYGNAETQKEMQQENTTPEMTNRGTYTDQLAYMYLRNLDELGGVVAGVMNVGKTMEQWGGGEEKRDTQSMLNQRLDRNGEALSHSLPQSRRKTAVVLGNDTVVMNGRVVTDEKLRKQILSRHEKRQKTVHDAATRTNIRTKKQAVQKKNAEAMQMSQYKQEYHTDFKEQYTFGAAKNIVDNINTEMVALSMSSFVELNQYQIDTLTALSTNPAVKLTKEQNDDMESQQTIGELQTIKRGVQRTQKYTKNLVTTVRNAHKKGKAKRQIKKTQREKVGKLRSSHKPPSAKAQKKKVEPKKTGKVSKVRNKAYSGKQKVQQMNQSFKSWKSGVKNKLDWKKKLANTKLGKAFTAVTKAVSAFAAKVVLIGAAAIFGISCQLAVAIVAISVIQSFANLPYKLIDNVLAPDTYEDTVAFRLYEYLGDEQDEWIASLRNFDELYNNRADLKYGINYENMSTYVGNMDNLEVDSGYFYINPFHGAVSSSDNAEYLTKVDGYDGRTIVEVSANTNSFNVRTEGNSTSASFINGKNDASIRGDYSTDNTAGGFDDYTNASLAGYSAIESGHTCNIKDIISMTDTLYQFTLDDFDDASMTSILGRSPSQINFDNFCAKVKSVFKWAGDAISAWWNGTEQPESFKDALNLSGTVSFKTIQNYATTLFECSHQQEIQLKVEYYPVADYLTGKNAGNKFVLKGGTDKTQDLTQKQASEVKLCVSPVTSKFEVAMTSNGKVEPFVEKGNNKYFLNENNGFDITVSTEDNMTSDNVQKLCLWSGFTNNEATYQKIVSKLREGCWSLKSDVTVDWTTIRQSVWGDWKDSESEAEKSGEDALEGALKKAYDKVEIPDSTYWVSADKNTFRKTSYSKPAFAVRDSQKVDSQTKQVFVRREMQYAYLYNNMLYYHFQDDPAIAGMNIIYEYVKFNEKLSLECDSSITNWQWARQETDGTTVYKYKDDVGRTQLMKYLYDQNKISFQYYYEKDDKWDLQSTNRDEQPDYCYPHAKWANRYKTQYRTKYSGNAVALQQRTEIYERKCQGHEYSYCGGHICVHSQGVVFSATNEQMAMTGIYSTKSSETRADDFVLKDNGYGAIKGKYDRSKFDYSTALTYSQSGGCESPLEDPQGSVTGMEGVNLIISGTEWAEGTDGIDASGISSRAHMLRDIFDVDCGIKKGRYLFPIKSGKPTTKAFLQQYEGWTEDNMVLALHRMAMDWNDCYGFDVPLELNMTKSWKDRSNNENINPLTALSDTDVKNIMDTLKTKYGASFTQERQDTVEYALRWVGRGHYSEMHTGHGFLSTADKGRSVSVSVAGETKTVQYSASCTAGNSEDFARFIYFKAGKVNRTGSSLSNEVSTKYGWQVMTSRDSLLPADLLRHGMTKGYGWVQESVLNAAEEGDGWSGSFISAMNRFKDESYVIYLGELDEDIKLQCGRTLQAGVPLCIDLTTYNGKGNIYLHGESNHNALTTKAGKTYTWLMNIDRPADQGKVYKAKISFH